MVDYNEEVADYGYANEHDGGDTVGSLAYNQEDEAGGKDAD
jgi:hypothetical protein